MMSKRHTARIGLVARSAAAWVCLCGAGSGLAQTDGNDLFELSLSELLSIEVTSVAKKSQPISQAAAAVYVITAEDIRRSGVTSIPEALRMAPGLEVAQVDGNKWAISARGSQGRFSNKLLVLMDGRTLYSPLFSGVFWDVQDTLLEDIERIEVIRGPGATLWGANAVNGVINIITRAARDTAGGLLVAGAGNQEHVYAGLRWGGAMGEAGHYRFYAKHFDRDGNQFPDSSRELGDDWDQQRIGFRAEFVGPRGADITLQGDAYRGASGSENVVIDLALPLQATNATDDDLSGYNFLARWQPALSDTDQLTLQTFIDQAKRDWEIADIDRSTFDFDLGYRTSRFAAHDVLIGFNYRKTRDRSAGSARVQVSPARREEEIFGAFIQDSWDIVEDRFSLIAGIKTELNDWTGFEYQPNLRLRWTPSDSATWWASATRAVRTPGRAERDARVLGIVLPPPTPGALPTAVVAEANRDFEAENLISFEAGFKQAVNERFSWDVAVFFNEYDEIRATQSTGTACLPDGELPGCLFDANTTAIAVLTQQDNLGEIESFGGEITASFSATENWRLEGFYSYLDEEASAGPGATVIDLAGREPRHQFSLRSAYQPAPGIDIDAWLRYADATNTVAGPIDSYATLDLRAAWRPVERVELSLTGRNLVNADRVEFQSELGEVIAADIQRSIHLQLRVDF